MQNPLPFTEEQALAAIRLLEAANVVSPAELIEIPWPLKRRKK